MQKRPRNGISGSHRVHPDVPWWFQLIRQRLADEKRGAWLMLRLARRLGLLDSAAWFPIGKERILVPLNWPGRIHLPNRFATYEPEAIAHFAKEMNSFAQDAVLIDCGADIGLYSRLVMQQTRK